jgi:hypothetical protein
MRYLRHANVGVLQHEIKKFLHRASMLAHRMTQGSRDTLKKRSRACGDLARFPNAAVGRSFGKMDKTRRWHCLVESENGESLQVKGRLTIVSVGKVPMYGDETPGTKALDRRFYGLAFGWRDASLVLIHFKSPC